MKLYTTTKAVKKIGISRQTYLDWVNRGFIKDVEKHPVFKERLFTDRDIKRVKEFKKKWYLKKIKGGGKI